MNRDLSVAGVLLYLIGWFYTLYAAITSQPWDATHAIPPIVGMAAGIFFIILGVFT